MEQFSNWQNSYAKAYNKVYHRTGSLFTDFMRRVHVNKDTQLGNTVFYIHKNPVQHGFAGKSGQWHWTSWKEYLTNRFVHVNSNEVVEWFGTIENFQPFHQQPLMSKKE